MRFTPQAARIATKTVAAASRTVRCPGDSALRARLAGGLGRRRMPLVRAGGRLRRACVLRDHGQLPDPRCTPGSIDPAVTQANLRSTICKSGYTKKVRPPESQTERFKYDVAYPAYRTPGSERTELDHLVPLELGGGYAVVYLRAGSGDTPAVTAASPGVRVSRAVASAAKTTVCSCRTSSNRSGGSVLTAAS